MTSSDKSRNERLHGYLIELYHTQLYTVINSYFKRNNHLDKNESNSYFKRNNHLDKNESKVLRNIIS
jgi:hypothetical protein